jgi:endoglucanase
MGLTPVDLTRRHALTGLAGGVAAALPLGRPLAANLTYPGVNLAGGEFGDLGRPMGQGYIYPPDSAFAYYAGRGLRLARLPFRIERLQSEPFGALTEQDVAELRRCAAAAKRYGLLLVLDPHNYGKRDDRPMAADDLADFWKRLAALFRDEPGVAYGLMNEPIAYEAAQWRPIVDRLVATIRDLGSTQLIMVPGAGWTGAHAWISDGNAAAFEDFRDSNFMFEVHQYLDPDSSGTDPQSYAPGAGEARLRAFTDWARARACRGFLGEFGFALPAGRTEAGAMLAHLAANSDVWKAYAYWAGGPWWGDYAFSIEPGKDGDKPQMALLRAHL